MNFWVFVGLSHNFSDAKRKEVVRVALGFFPNSAMGMGFGHWEVGFREEMGWEMGLVGGGGGGGGGGLGNGTGTPPPPPDSGPSNKTIF